jgi:hypothetical protein
LTTQQQSTVSDDDLIQMLGLMRQADSVELKLTVDMLKQRAAVRRLGIDPLDAQIRQVYFFDTPDLTLYKAGVVPRARRIQGKEHDSVVKLRPVVPNDLPKEVRSSPNFSTEVDRMPNGYVCSGSMKSFMKEPLIKEVVQGEKPIRKLFSKEQREFYAAHAPAGIALDDLVPLGPIFVLKAKFMPHDFPRKVTAELWLYPDGSRVFELSTKAPPNLAFQAVAEGRAFLRTRGVELDSEQSTKTRLALEFFAKEAKEAEKAEKAESAAKNGAGSEP